MKPNLFCFAAGGTDPHEIKLTVPEKDRAAYDALPHRSRKSILVTNITGTTYRVRRHSCSLGCYCAALAEPVANSN